MKGKTIDYLGENPMESEGQTLLQESPEHPLLRRNFPYDNGSFGIPDFERQPK